MNNKILKIICSLPIILITLYFIPILGICLIILRYVTYSSKKYLIPTWLIITGLLLLIPKIVNEILKLLNFKTEKIPYLNDIVNSNIYQKLIDYSKFILCLGIILLIIYSIFKKLFNKLTDFIKNYIQNKESTNAEIARKNDLQIKLKQEKAKNTHVVFCPNCGADNILTEKIGTCKFCRRKIKYKENI